MGVSSTRRWCVVVCLMVCWKVTCGSEALNYNGGSVLAMAGKECAVVVVDQRFGVGNSLIGEEATRVLDCGERSVVAMRGLQGDVQTFMEDIDARLRLRWIQEDSDGDGPRFSIEPDKLSAMISMMLYGSRSRRRSMPYYLEPVIAGVKKSGEVFVCGQDSLGAQLASTSYVVAGTATQSLHGACEALYEPDLDPEALVDRAVKCMAAGLNRDCLGGKRVVVHLVSKNNKLKAFHRPLLFHKTVPAKTSAGRTQDDDEKNQHHQAEEETKKTAAEVPTTTTA